MEDPEDEFEPLFDYSGVQPLNLVCLDDDDDDDTLKAFPSKRLKVSDVENLPPSEEEVIQIKDSEDKDEDDDWLPAPVKVPIDTENREEDSIIKALRLKKQELLSYTQSAEELLRSVDEVTKKDLNTSVQFSSNSIAEPMPKSASERTKIIISIQDKDKLKHFRVYMDDKFERLFKLYADSVKLDIQTLAFSFDGDKISPTATPASLGMEDNDIVEVHIKSR